MLDRDLAGQLHQPCLADGVGRVPGRADHSVLGGDVHDPATGVAAGGRVSIWRTAARQSMNGPRTLTAMMASKS